MKIKLIFTVVFNLFFFSSVFAGQKYIGSEQCFMCHDEQRIPWKSNIHSKLNNECEACHGMGGLHQETMNKKDIVVKPNVKVCGGCHFIYPGAGNNRKERRIYPSLWEKSAHSQMGFTCLDCHNPHKVKNKKLLLINGVKWNCYNCHADKKKAFEKSIHGKRGAHCNACHLPHGSAEQHLLKIVENGKHFCQACHLEEPHHFIANKITQKMKNLKCTDCHKGHFNGKKSLKYKKEDLCSHCHKPLY